MSMLTIGSQCSTCNLIDFLPFNCPNCSQTFCQSHIQSHPCPSSSSSSSSHSSLGRPIVKRGIARCPVVGCDKETIESRGGLSGLRIEFEHESTGKEQWPSDLAKGESEDVTKVMIAQTIRCPGCDIAYCTTHRAQTAHNCSGPNLTDARHNAIITKQLETKKKVESKLGKPLQFKPKIAVPVQVDRTKNEGDRPAPVPFQTNTSSGFIPTSTSTPTPTVLPVLSCPVVKTKADRLYDLHVRKIRIGAKPLDPRCLNATGDERRSFEWGIAGDLNDLKKWERGEIVDKVVLHKGWVLKITSGGKLLDLIISASKTARPKTNEPSKALSLVVTSSDSSKDQKPRSVQLPIPIETQILDGDLVILVRGFEGQN